ncbi:MAG: DUF1592 domain-containing protein [Acidobacteria bacterium]|nr:DUF1592 domain-containing protein [Acidobacteriota bacterium]
MACHQGKAPAGELNLERALDHEQWQRTSNRVRNFEMPPKGARAPSVEEREAFSAQVAALVHDEVCAAEVKPAPAPIRRLNQSEYTSTIRDLLEVQVNVGALLPADGAGGEGFDNAAETLFLSPVHAEKYLDSARLALEAAARDSKARAKLFIATPNEGVKEEDAARTILKAFLPRAFRRPVADEVVEDYAALFRTARKRQQTFEDSVFFTLRAVLISPNFLFLVEPRPVDDYALASRLSYFLVGSMPDAELFQLAAQGKLRDETVLRAQVKRLLASPGSIEFETRFVEQWLGTRELGRTVGPDAKLFPAFADDELRSDIRYQPVVFFREILSNDLSLLNLLDSKFTTATRKLQKLYGLNIKPPRPDAGGQPQRIELPEGSQRGGLVGMSAVLMASSYPHRTSPVLRGKWLLETLLGTPPPPPPPNVPPLEENGAASARTVRERLAQHRKNPVCASCHSRIDPMGFALENFDPMGRWRTEDAGQPIDNTGELADGRKFAGPEGLRARCWGTRWDAV